MAAAYHGNTQTEPAKMEQIITAFFAKTLHVVLESRSPYVSSRHYSGEQNLSSPSSSSSSPASTRPRDKWFNLALPECPAALENIDFWHQSILEPMVIDVILVQKPLSWDPADCSPRKSLGRNLSGKEQYPSSLNSELDELGFEVKNEKVIERWIVHYESRKGNRENVPGYRRSSSNSSHVVYKKSVLLLRSLYLTVRLLPAYKLFRDLISSGQIKTYNLTHRVSSFVEPFTRREESDMQHFIFNPVDTSCGRLCVSVLYRSSLSDTGSEPSTPMSPQFIPDYVGSPLADPLKRFPSLPAPQGSASSSPFERRHSWSYDQYRVSPPSAFPSPSPTYSDSHASVSRFSSPHLPPMSVPRYLHEAPQVHTKQTSIDEYWPFPTFSPSPSPSPPTYVSDRQISKALLRSESAPLSIPQGKLSNTPLLLNTQNFPPSPPLKAARVISRMDRGSSLVQTGSASAVGKLLPLGGGESGNSLGVRLSSNSSPRKSYSRSSSRLSYEDTFDDSEFSGPFVVDDDDTTDPGSRPPSFDQRETNEPGGIFPIVKSQDAAVGALVHMLKKAPPLRQDLSESRNLGKSSKCGSLGSRVREPVQTSANTGFQQAGSSSLEPSGAFSSKTTSDALEELRGYREMKDLLLRQGGKS